MIIFFSLGYTRRTRDLSLSNVESLIRMSKENRRSTRMVLMLVLRGT